MEHKNLISVFPLRYRSQIAAYNDGIYEVRIRRGGVVTASTAKGNTVLGGGKITHEEFKRLFSELCSGAPYAYEDDFKRGFFTVEGCRVGVCGTALTDRGIIVGIKDIRSLNLRFAREIRGASESLLNMLGGDISGGLLLAGAPACGKTTLLRDIARRLSESGNKVCVIDERGEIAATSNGALGVDLGPHTDVLDGYPKTSGMEIALRSLSPNIIICDEIGKGEAAHIAECADCGVDVIASVHSVSESSPRFSALADSRCFRHAAFFKRGTVGVIERIITL